MADTQQRIALSVPPEASFARTVRMMAANLAVCCEAAVDEVEDLRIAAEEGFIYSCSTKPKSCDIDFVLSKGSIAIDFSLGPDDPAVRAGEEEQALDLVELLLEAVCDDFNVSEDGSVLHLVKQLGVLDASV